MPEDTLIGLEYPRIVDDRTWNLAQVHRQNSTRQREGTKPKLPFALHGLLWGDHFAAKYTIGTSYTYRRQKGEDGSKTRVRTDNLARRYVCNTGKRPVNVLGRTCPKRTISARLVEQVVWEEITRFLTDPTQLRTLIDERRQHLEEGGVLADLESARTKVAEVEKEKGRTLNLYTLGHIDETDLDVRLKGVDERLEYYQVEVSRLEAGAANANQALEALDNYSGMASTLKDRLETMDESERIGTIRLLVNRVIVEEQGFKIVMALDAFSDVRFEPPRECETFPNNIGGSFSFGLEYPSDGHRFGQALTWVCSCGSHRSGV